MERSSRPSDVMERMYRIFTKLIFFFGTRIIISGNKETILGRKKNVSR